MEYLCSVCGAKIVRGRYFCYKCYCKFKSEIISKQPWTLFLQNEEKRRRRHLDMIYLGETEDGVIWQVGNRKDTN
jgi:hypothetical protein